MIETHDTHILNGFELIATKPWTVGDDGAKQNIVHGGRPNTSAELYVCWTVSTPKTGASVKPQSKATGD